MRKLFIWLGVSIWLLAGLYLGCAAGNPSNYDDDNSSSGNSNSGAGGGISTTTFGGAPPGDGGLDPDSACAKFSAEAEQAPAAMLVVLDASASMNTAGKWAAAQLAVVTAVDKDVFDSMSLGLVTFPTSLVTGPQCVFGFQVTCGYSALAQVPMAFAGPDKSNAGVGVRSGIYNYLVSHNPVSSNDDGSPVYDSMAAGYNALKAFPGVDKRILVLISDGGFSCTSLSSPPRQAFQDLNGCADWEHPDNVNTLIKSNHGDANTPVSTFIVGVPGSNTNGGKTGPFDNPPYPMLLALSTYAVSGSPATVPADCDQAAVFSQNGQVPAKPCHIDLSSGQFDATALADAIAKIRGSVLGCVYPLPEPPPGESINLDQVNVNVTLDGKDPFLLAKRSDPKDSCDVDGCWDYTAKNEVEILGKTCLDISEAASAKVDILVGCETILK